MARPSTGWNTSATSNSRARRRETKGEDMPHVIVKLWPGKSEQQKRRLAQAITKDVMDVLHYGDESVSVAFEEVDAAEWAAKVYQPEIVGKSALLYKKPGYTM